MDANEAAVIFLEAIEFRRADRNAYANIHHAATGGWEGQLAIAAYDGIPSPTKIEEAIKETAPILAAACSKFGLSSIPIARFARQLRDQDEREAEECVANLQLHLVSANALDDATPCDTECDTGKKKSRKSRTPTKELFEFIAWHKSERRTRRELRKTTALREFCDNDSRLFERLRAQMNANRDLFAYATPDATRR